MKTASVSLLLGVCVLLLSALTVSAVSLHVSPNLQQFFSGYSKIFLSCVDDDDGQTVDGWTVKRTRGGHTEECGAADSEFRRINSSFCVLYPNSSYSAVLWCENSSGQKSDEVSISVSSTENGLLMLEIPALPVRTGSEVTLYCKTRDGSGQKFYFHRDGNKLWSEPEGKLILYNVHQSDEGLYWCSTDMFGASTKSRLRVRDAPPNTTPPSSSSPPILVPVVAGLVSVFLLVLVLVGVQILWRKLKGCRGADSVSMGLWCCGGDSCEEPAEKCLRVKWSVCLCCVCVLLLSALTVSAVTQHASGVEVYEGEESVLLPCQVPVSDIGGSTSAVWNRNAFKIPTVHVHLQIGDDLISQNQRYLGRTSMRAEALQTGDLSLTLRNPTVSDSGTYTCTFQRGGRDQSQKNIQLKVKASMSFLRLFCHLVVFCPYCISTSLLLSVCCSRKTPNKPAFCMEMTQRDGGSQGLDEEYDNGIADVTTEHAF